MSRVWTNENGLVSPGAIEWLNSYSWCRSSIPVPQGTGGKIYILAGARPSAMPLEVYANSRHIGNLYPAEDARLRWYSLPVPSDAVAARCLSIELRGRSGAGGWAVAIEFNRSGTSEYSKDRGATWTHELGVNFGLAGEYVIRFYSDETHGTDDAPPPAWAGLRRDSQSAVPGSDVLLDRLGSDTVADKSDDVVARVLAARTSRLMTFNNSEPLYAPWEPNIILDWSGPSKGYGGFSASTMCVHYSVVLAAALNARSIPARHAVFTEGIGTYRGHFCVEYWSSEYHKWALIDPSLMVSYWLDGEPMSGIELTESTASLYQRLRPVADLDDDAAASLTSDWRRRSNDGLKFANYGVWPRQAEIAGRSTIPRLHGLIEYCEMGFVWHESCRARGFEMFQWFADDEYFKRAPQIINH